MNYTSIDNYEMYYPTKVGCTQDEKDNEYSELLDKITASPRVAIVNIVNNTDGSFHTIGFIPLDGSEEDDPYIDDLKDYIHSEAYYESDAGRNYDLEQIFDEEDFSIEFYSTENDLQKITEYLDCIYATENLNVSVTPADDETDEDFCDTIKKMNENLFVALAGDPQCDDSLVIVASEDVTDANIKSIDNLPILFSDVFEDITFSKIGEIKTDLDVTQMHYTSNDTYSDLEGCLRNMFGNEWYDTIITEDEDENAYPYSDEGPSDDMSDKDDTSESLEEKPVEKLVITTPKYKATVGVKKVEINTERKNIPSTRVNNKTNLNLKEEKKMNLFAKLNFKPVQAAITFDGLLAIDVNTDPKLETQYKAVDKEDNVIDVMDETIAMELPLLMPVMGQAPEVGDYVQQGGTWYKILADKSALNITNGTVAGLKMNFTQFFKSSVFYRAMINPANMMSNGLMMAMLLNGEGEGKGNFDVKSLMMLSMMNGQNSDFLKNPMFLMFLMGDQGGNGGFDMKTLMMMNMFNGGANPFAGFLGAATAPTEVKAEDVPATPAKTGKRK